jgi:protein TonB
VDGQRERPGISGFAAAGTLDRRTLGLHMARYNPDYGDYRKWTQAAWPSNMCDVYSIHPSWFVLALLLHGGLWSMAHLWPQDRIEARPGKTIQVSLIEMAAPKTVAPPPPAPLPPKPKPPKPKLRAVRAPRPVVPESAMPEPEIPAVPVSEAEAPAETPVVAAPVSESTATQTGAATVTDAPAAAQASASFVEARADAAYLHNPKPPYPPMSRRLREEGTVRLRVHVLPDGHADRIEIQRGSGFPRLDESARVTVLRWRFIPGRRGDEAIASWVIIPIHFNLE